MYMQLIQPTNGNLRPIHCFLFCPNSSPQNVSDVNILEQKLLCRPPDGCWSFKTKIPWSYFCCDYCYLFFAMDSNFYFIFLKIKLSSWMRAIFARKIKNTVYAPKVSGILPNIISWLNLSLSQNLRTRET